MIPARLLHEVADVARGLARRPLVPATLAAVVALGVAFLVTAFGVFDAMLWRDLPYGPRSRFLLLGEVRESEGYPPMPRLRVDTYAGYREAFARGRLPVLDGLVPLEEHEVTLLVDGVATRTRATRLLPESFAVVRARPILGRTPADPDGSGRLAREVAIGERLWTRRFARDPGVLGRAVTVDGEAATIVGVLPADFSFHRFAELWTAWSEREILADPRASILVVGRVAEGRRRDEVSDFTEPVRRAVRAERVPADTMTRAYHAHGIFGTDFIHPTFARYVFGMLALVLVAACLNVATLFLARLRGRVPEYATRQALGAGAAGVLRLLLVEAAIVVAVGGVAGAGLAGLAMLLVRDAASGVLLSWMDVRLEWRSAVVALAAAAVALVVVALPAARALRRLDLARLLVHAGVIGRAPRHGRGASALVAAQVALVVLLAAAALPIAV